jgi:hypothetical protein
MTSAVIVDAPRLAVRQQQTLADLPALVLPDSPQYDAARRAVDPDRLLIGSHAVPEPTMPAVSPRTPVRRP